MFLALAEIRRGRLRFGLLAGAVGLLVFLVLFVQSITDGLVRGFIGALENQSAEVLVYAGDARQNLEGSRVPAEVVDAVAAVPGVGRAGPLGEGTFTVTAGEELQEAVLFGYALDGPGAPTRLVDGRLPERDGEAVASERDRDDGFGIGDVVRIEPGGTQIEVVGLAADSNYSVSPVLFTSFATYEDARRAANPDAREVLPSAVAVEPAEGEDAAAVADRIGEAVEGIEALTRAEAVDQSPGVSSVRQSFSLVTVLFYLVVPLVTGLFFLILTVQKTSALTLLRAVGARRRTLVGALLLQVALVLAVGIVLAILLLLASSVVMSAAEIGIEVAADPAALLTTAVLVIVLAMLTALVAARRILAIDPVRAVAGAGVGE